VKERWYEFVKDCKDAVKEVAPAIGVVAVIFAAVFSLAFLTDKSEEKKDKPKPKPTATVAAVVVPTPEPTPTPTPKPTLSPEELDRLIAEEEARWRQEALEYAAENLPQNYKELVYEDYLLLEAYDELVVDNENLESRVYDLEEEVMDLEDDLDYQMGY
jgi:hypothetical protein